MRAIVQHKYGPPEQLSLREVDTPSPKAGEVLVKIHAAGVNDWDLGLLYGKPIFMRFLSVCSGRRLQSLAVKSPAS